MVSQHLVISILAESAVLSTQYCTMIGSFRLSYHVTEYCTMIGSFRLSYHVTEYCTMIGSFRLSYHVTEYCTMIGSFRLSYHVTEYCTMIGLQNGAWLTSLILSMQGPVVSEWIYQCYCEAKG